VIRTEGLTKHFALPGSNGLLTAVDALDLDVRPGEVFGFLGPNGAGKTTTVRMLTTLIAASGGRGWVNGHHLTADEMAVRRSVGVLTETPGLYEKMSAWHNLAFYARLYGVDRVDARVEKYLRLIDLWERRRDVVSEFSKGMKQKLAIARALVHEPKTVFLDEPTAALDPESSLTIREFIGELKSEGRTIFLCTHNLDEAERLCDRVAIFKTRLIRADTPANLRRALFGRSVVVHVRNPGGRWLEVARELSFVRDARLADGRLVVRLEDPEEENPALVRRLVEAGAEVQFVGEMRHSLEDVYLRLVRGETPNRVLE
jgi:ABC-2 type transport system ATP-binding protein